MATTRGHHSGVGHGGRYKKTQHTDASSPVIQAFLEYQQLLDTRHDKHERLVKLSRDVTIDSKRVIFLLHRAAGGEELQTVLKQAEEKLSLVKEKLAKIAQELHGEDPYQFLRAYSPGLQEYIEAVTFYQFLHSGTLADLEYVQSGLTFPHKPDETPEGHTDEGSDKHAGETDTHAGEETVQVHVPPVEYMLGVADLTGELMRLTINSAGAGDLQTPFTVCPFLRLIHDSFLSYCNVSRELNRKMNTLRQSLQKVENACYIIQVRGSEIPKHLLADVLSGQGDSSFSNTFHDEGEH